MVLQAFLSKRLIEYQNHSSNCDKSSIVSQFRKSLHVSLPFGTANLHSHFKYSDSFGRKKHISFVLYSVLWTFYPVGLYLSIFPSRQSPFEYTVEMLHSLVFCELWKSIYFKRGILFRKEPQKETMKIIKCKSGSPWKRWL